MVFGSRYKNQRYCLNNFSKHYIKNPSLSAGVFLSMILT